MLKTLCFLSPFQRRPSGPSRASDTPLNPNPPAPNGPGAHSAPSTPGSCKPRPPPAKTQATHSQGASMLPTREKDPTRTRKTVTFSPTTVIIAAPPSLPASKSVTFSPAPTTITAPGSLPTTSQLLQIAWPPHLRQHLRTNLGQKDVVGDRSLEIAGRMARTVRLLSDVVQAIEDRIPGEEMERRRLTLANTVANSEAECRVQRSGLGMEGLDGVDKEEEMGERSTKVRFAELVRVSYVAYGDEQVSEGEEEEQEEDGFRRDSFVDEEEMGGEGLGLLVGGDEYVGGG